MESEKISLWTRQDIRSLEDLENQGVHRIKREYLEEEFPIWCAISEKNMYRPIKGTVVYVLEIDRSKVIYFDGLKWDYVLNHLYIPKDKEDEKSYMEEMKKKGIKDRFSFIDGKYASLYPEERKRVMESWPRIFEIDDWNIFNVQENIWEIRKEDIRDIIYYQP